MPSSPTFNDVQRAALTAIRDHHAELTRAMADHVMTLCRWLDRLQTPVGRQMALVDFCDEVVLPHALAEEKILYAAGEQVPEIRLLVAVMRAEYLALRSLTDELKAARLTAGVVGGASALYALFCAHVEKENEVFLPALADAGVDLPALLSEIHDLLGGAEMEERA
ncbi:hemerythrin domain-containing protein [Nonomuraea basaltis]|uniref:hemerythrin domain-containing protein n=1 Tax=Nonomuraea basaltis TaxID=2495887 RepID=UPI0014873475|nr:hemerythrin domain-containing protein [Nonomuraea basaltis]